MSRLLSICRYIIVSPEFLVCLVGFSSYIVIPEQFSWLSDRINKQAELLKYFGFLPVGMIVYDSNVVKNILMPNGDKKNMLQKWDLYSDFKSGCIVGLGYAVLFGIAGLASLLFDWNKPAAHQSALLLTSIVGGAMVSTTLYFAQIQIEELFRKHSAPLA